VHSNKINRGEENVKLFRSNGYCALPFLTLLSSPAFAASYSENMHLGEYIVGLAALALVVWDIARRYTQRAGGEGHPASGSPIAAATGIARQLCDAGIWGKIREVVLDHPFEASVLVCSFALLNFARVPFSLSAALVGTITYLSLVLGARLAAHSGTRPAAAKPAVQPAAARPAIVTRPAPQPAAAAKPAPRRPVLATKPETAKPTVAEAAPAKASEAPAEAPAASAETAAPAKAEAAAAPAEAPETKAAAPAPRRRASGTSTSPSRPSRRRTTAKPKT
jgi:hypothetical protein